MKLIKALIIASTLTTSYAVYADKASDKQAVDDACKADAATAGCGSEQVGSGLLKCIHAYKKSHKEFKLSDACKSASKQLHADKKAAKAAKTK